MLERRHATFTTLIWLVVSVPVLSLQYTARMKQQQQHKRQRELWTSGSDGRCSSFDLVGGQSARLVAAVHSHNEAAAAAAAEAAAAAAAA
jgi:hypothetical protein